MNRIGRRRYRVQLRALEGEEEGCGHIEVDHIEVGRIGAGRTEAGRIEADHKGARSWERSLVESDTEKACRVVLAAGRHSMALGILSADLSAEAVGQVEVAPLENKQEEAIAVSPPSSIAAQSQSVEPGAEAAFDHRDLRIPGEEVLSPGAVEVP